MVNISSLACHDLLNTTATDNSSISSIMLHGTAITNQFSRFEQLAYGIECLQNCCKNYFQPHSHYNTALSSQKSFRSFFSFCCFHFCVFSNSDLVILNKRWKVSSLRCC